VSDPASEALEALARDLVAQISAGQLELAREQLGHDLAVKLASPPAPDPVVVQADPSGISEYTTPPPGLCADPLCDHMTLRCPRNRTHLVGGHPGNRSQFISKGATNAPAGSASPRGRRRLSASGQRLPHMRRGHPPEDVRTPIRSPARAMPPRARNRVRLWAKTS
jgi:hypothetical protein